MSATRHAGATHLVTGDVFRFGPCFGTTIREMQVTRPGNLLGGRPD